MKTILPTPSFYHRLTLAEKNEFNDFKDMLKAYYKADASMTQSEEDNTSGTPTPPDNDNAKLIAFFISLILALLSFIYIIYSQCT